MAPKRKVKSGKMDNRKTLQPVAGHPTRILPTVAEAAATRAMNEPLDEVLTTHDPHSGNPLLRIRVGNRPNDEVDEENEEAPIGLPVGLTCPLRAKSTMKYHYQSPQIFRI